MHAIVIKHKWKTFIKIKCVFSFSSGCFLERWQADLSVKRNTPTDWSLTHSLLGEKTICFRVSFQSKKPLLSFHYFNPSVPKQEKRSVLNNCGKGGSFITKKGAVQTQRDSLSWPSLWLGLSPFIDDQWAAYYIIALLTLLTAGRCSLLCIKWTSGMENTIVVMTIMQLSDTKLSCRCIQERRAMYYICQRDLLLLDRWYDLNHAYICYYYYGSKVIQVHGYEVDIQVHASDSWV